MKRFTSTEKWDDPWFRRLHPTMKCLWLFLCDRCDPSGVWTVDREDAEHRVGCKIPFDKVFEAFGHRIEKVENRTEEAWRVVKFVSFQYPNLSRDCKPHKPVYEAIQRNGLDENSVKQGKAINTLPLGFQSLQDKDTDKEKDKATEKEGGEAEKIYSIYPRKEARADALKAIRNVLKTKPADQLTEAVTAYAAAVALWPVADRQFIPHPATWFNRGSYDDDRSRWKRQVFSGGSLVPARPASSVPDNLK